MLTKTSAIERAKQFLSECQKLPINIERAVLFGSASKDTMTEYSDIDIALFSKNFTDNILDNLDLIGLVNIRFPEIDAHTYNSKDYESDQGILMDEIIKTGVEIQLK